MPLQKIQFKAGVNRENTNYTNEGGWFDCDKIRFRSGFPEKLGGWVKFNPGGGTYDGVCRALINWVDLDSNDLIGVGTHKKYYILPNNTDYKNITPLRSTVSPTGNNPFATTSGSSLITVTINAHGAAVGDYVTFSGTAGPIAGLAAGLFDREFEIVEPVTTNTFVIDLGVGNTANATTTGGGAVVDAEFQLSIGLPVYTVGNGFGAGVWNGTIKTLSTNLAYTSGSGNVLLDNVSTTINVDDTTGFTNTGFIQVNAEVISYTGKTATSFTGCVRGATINGANTTASYHSLPPTSGSATPPPILVYQVLTTTGATGWGAASSIGFGVGQQLRLWTHDTYGENLLINPRGGNIYYWINNTSTYPAAEPLADIATANGFNGAEVPTNTNQIIVAERFVIALGAQPFGSATFDPMLVRWSDQENPYQWEPLSTNQSGDFVLTSGSYIVCGKKARQEVLIWTDSTVYSMQYLGAPFVWRVTLLMDNISIISPNAVSVASNLAFWMGVDKFYVYSGRVDTLPCTVRQYIFQDLAFSQQFQVVSGTNEGFSEVWWYYVSNAEVQRAIDENRKPTVDKYVIYNYLDNAWYYGTLNRTAWLDSGLQPGPLAAVGNTEIGELVQHETGVDDNLTNQTRPIEAYIQSSDFDIGDGHNFGFVWRLLPDVTFAGSTTATPRVNMSLLPRTNSGTNYRGLTALSPQGITSSATVIPVLGTSNFPSNGILLINNEKIQYTGKTLTSFTGCTRGFLSTTAEAHPVNDTVSYFSTQTDVTKNSTYPVEQFTGQIYTRVRGRQMAFRISSTDIGTAWQLGCPRVDIRNDGRR